jgi:hypothetical protein
MRMINYWPTRGYYVQKGMLLPFFKSKTPCTDDEYAEALIMGDWEQAYCDGKATTVARYNDMVYFVDKRLGVKRLT